MKPDQKHSPKYWVVHDKQTDDVFLFSAHRTKTMAEMLFIEQQLPNYPSQDYNSLYELFFFVEGERYSTILIEIKEVGCDVLLKRP